MRCALKVVIPSIYSSTAGGGVVGGADRTIGDGLAAGSPPAWAAPGKARASRSRGPFMPLIAIPATPSAMATTVRLTIGRQISVLITTASRRRITLHNMVLFPHPQRKMGLRKQSLARQHSRVN